MLPRSMTTCGTCDEAELSRYTSGLPFTVCCRTGKSARMRSTSHVPATTGSNVDNVLTSYSVFLTQRHKDKKQSSLRKPLCLRFTFVPLCEIVFTPRGSCANAATQSHPA